MRHVGNDGKVLPAHVQTSTYFGEQGSYPREACIQVSRRTTTLWEYEITWTSSARTLKLSVKILMSSS